MKKYSSTIPIFNAGELRFSIAREILSLPEKSQDTVVDVGT